VISTTPDFSHARVLVAGDVMLDRYLFGGTSRISPEAPVPVVHVRDTDDRPGGAANVAINLASLGAKTALMGYVGRDDEAHVLQSMLQAEDIDCRFSVTDRWPTITKTRVISRSQQLIRFDREEPCNDPDMTLSRPLADALQAIDLVILSDYGKGALTDVIDMIAACREQGIAVLVDPKGTDFGKYAGATLLTPNQSEFEAVVGRCRSDDDLVQQATSMLNELGLNGLLVTRSAKGMLLVEVGQEPLFLSTHAREVYDVTGAGDTVIATVGAALASGESFAVAATLANIAAGVVVRKIGVATVSPSEIQIASQRIDPGSRGLLSELELLTQLVDARQRGERIVFTNGCFDVLHAGHVGYLEDASNLGDRLIVAVNDDASVTRLKGAPRPVNPLADRMTVLAGLSSVDWVVPFAEDTPLRLLKEIMPDVLAKGGDYAPEDVVGASDVQAAGGEVRILPFRDGHSSSSIIDRLQNK
jgi:D-beta-D-heptose 7-phosphate kinase / D-beta-D-heptose 1-phosphate adenosyltransferase